MSKFKVGDLVCTQTDPDPGIRQGGPYVVSGCSGELVELVEFVEFVDDAGWLRSRPADRYTLYKTPEEHADDEFRETTFAPLVEKPYTGVAEAAVNKLAGQVLGTEADPTGNGPDTESSKASNPKQAFGDLKAQLGLVPDTLQYFAAMAFFEGASKYGAFNWRVAGVRASTYKAAAERHLKKWFNGEECDPVTGVPHLANAIACLGIIVDAAACDKLEDDRPPVVDLGTLEAYVATVQAGLREQHVDKSPTHWTAAAVKETK